MENLRGYENDCEISQSWDLQYARHETDLLSWKEQIACLVGRGGLPWTVHREP